MSWGAVDVAVRFGNRVALDGVTFEAPAGQVTAVVGGDGAGKTTLLRALGGALVVDRGEIRRPDASRIGYLSATTGTYPDLTVEESLEFAATAYGVPPVEARERATEHLERTGLASARDRLAGQLSGGMRHKLGVIQALLHRPELVVLDEPATGVDPVSRADLWWLVARAAADGAAVVLSTTYLDEAERAATLLVLDAGRQLARGTAAEIVASTPGTIRATSGRPTTDGGSHVWRRGSSWRVWHPNGQPPARTGATAPSTGRQTHHAPGTDDASRPFHPDLQDAVTALALSRDGANGSEPADTTAAPAASDTPPASGASDASSPPATVEPPGGAATGSVARPREPASSAPLAVTRGVTRRFGRFVAVDDVDLELGPGEVVGLLGANGAGKTTLIRMLLGLLRPSGGEVALFGEPPSRRTRSRLGYVPQGLGLYDDLTPAENLDFAHAVFGQGNGLPARLASVADTPVGQLPLGIQRRVAFAEALGHQPELLVLDEPTSGVDPLGRARLWETIHATAEQGVGVLVTTHYMDEATECDRLVVMSAGRVVVVGTVDDITGDATVVTVESDTWADAFAALERAGIPAALVGTSLRAPGVAQDEVERALGDVPADLHQTPATLEERFFELTAASPGPAS